MITYQDIINLYKGRGVRCEVLCFNPSYLLPTPAWIPEKLGPASDKLYFDTGIVFQPGKFECESFSLVALAHAKLCWANTVAQPNDDSIAVGGFAYGNHFLITAVHRDAAGGIYPAFYEPQPSVPEGKAVFRPVCLNRVTLSDDDVRACLFCAFF